MVGFSLGQKTCPLYIFFVTYCERLAFFLQSLLFAGFLSNFEEKMKFSPFPPQYFFVLFFYKW